MQLFKKKFTTLDLHVSITLCDLRPRESNAHEKDLEVRPT